MYLNILDRQLKLRAELGLKRRTVSTAILCCPLVAAAFLANLLIELCLARCFIGTYFSFVRSLWAHGMAFYIETILFYLFSSDLGTRA